MTQPVELPSPADAPVRGDCDPRFARVRDAFQDNFAAGSETGAALAVQLNGEPVLDLWGGWMDAQHSRAWQRDTLVCCYSVGKAVSAILLWRLVERGVLDIDGRVADHWPEFAAAGKENVRIRWLLSHQAGLPAIRRPLPRGSQLRWDTMCEALAAQQPWWPPGAAHGYHSNTQGFLIGELIRRATGVRIGAFLQQELGEPAGIDFHFGTRPEHDARTADILPMQQPPDLLRSPPNPLQLLANRNPPSVERGPGSQNSREYRAAEFPSTNGHGNARALARLYGALATDGQIKGQRDGQMDGQSSGQNDSQRGGAHILAPRTIAAASAEQVYGLDRVLGRRTRFGSGFQLAMRERPLGPNPQTFGHFGGGGSLGFADSAAGIGFGYTMNQGRPGWQHRHVRRLIDLLYESL